MRPMTIIATALWGLVSLTTALHAQGNPPWGEDLVDLELYGPGGSTAGFGRDVGISGDYFAVGVGADSSGGPATGAVRIYERNLGGPGAWGAGPILIGSSSNGGDRLGDAVAISGTLVAAGATFADSAGAQFGEVYLFDASTGLEIAQILAPTILNGFVQQFGRAVDTDGTYVIAGGAYDSSIVPGLNDFGFASLYDATGAALSSLTPSGTDNSFGRAVAVGGAYCAVSAPAKDVGGAPFGTGAVHVFDSATGAELYVLSQPGATGSAQFGKSLDIQGTRLLVGSNMSTMWCYDLLTGTELWSWNAEGLYFGIAKDVALTDQYAYATMGTIGSGSSIGRIGQVCVDTGRTVTWFTHDSTGAVLPPILGQDSLAADGDTIVSGSEIAGVAGSFEGAVHIMTRSLLGTGINRQTAFALWDTIDLTVRGGSPGQVAGFAFTEINGVPVFIIYSLGVFDANGEYSLFSIPLTGAGGNSLRMAGGGIAKNGTAVLATSRPLQIL